KKVAWITTCTQAFVNETFYDGLGRAIQQRAEIAEGNSQSVVNTVYDAVGRAVTTFVPTSESWTTAFSRPAGWDIRPKTTTAYDALSRPTVITAPDGTTTNHYYVLDNNPGGQGYTATNLWLHSVKDANNHARHEVMDAFGRTVKVREFTGTSFPWSLYAETVYVYGRNGFIESGPMRQMYQRYRLGAIGVK
ncbi:MAG: DUF6443 domain-containing protein, partial [Anaerolineales bacterium]